MRKVGWLGVITAAMALSIYTSAPVSGQQQQQAPSQQALPRPYGTPPPMVITAFGGKPVTYKAPRTPWGDPDLQGVWSSDDMLTEMPPADSPKIVTRLGSPPNRAMLSLTHFNPAI